MVFLIAALAVLAAALLWQASSRGPDEEGSLASALGGPAEPSAFAGSQGARSTTQDASPTAASDVPIDGNLVLANRGKTYKIDPLATPIPFTKTDFIRLTADPPPRTIHLGEPFVITLRLINHTQFRIAAITNFHPRGQLEVKVQAPGRRPRRVTGPFAQGHYPNRDILLYPLDEFSADVIVWSDPTTENGLAFPRPGNYQVEVKLRSVGAQHSRISGEVPLVAPDLTPLAPFALTVLAPRESDRALVETLAELKAFPHLHLRDIGGQDAPPGFKERIEELIEEFPASSLTPYLDYSVAIQARIAIRAAGGDTAQFALAAKHFQRAALADSAFKLMAYEDLIRLYDSNGYPFLARDAVVALMQAAPPDRAIGYGSRGLIKKYLINSAEISPADYWHFFD